MGDEVKEKRQGRQRGLPDYRRLNWSRDFSMRGTHELHAQAIRLRHFTQGHNVFITVLRQQIKWIPLLAVALVAMVVLPLHHHRARRLAIALVNPVALSLCRLASPLRCLPIVVFVASSRLAAGLVALPRGRSFCLAIIVTSVASAYARCHCFTVWPWPLLLLLSRTC